MLQHPLKICRFRILPQAIFPLTSGSKGKAHPQIFIAFPLLHPMSSAIAPIRKHFCIDDSNIAKQAAQFQT
jgi:hypothetical protein